MASLNGIGLSSTSAKASIAPSLAEEPTAPALQVAGLFAGIGGIECGLSAAGHITRLVCEIDPAANAVLNAHFAGSDKVTDVRELDCLPEATTLVTAGFPCQDLSQAGKTAGISGERSGLVGEVFRLIGRQPIEWVLLENVSFMLQLGGGLALEVILKTFEALGYKWAYRVVNSRAFGVPQRRERVYILASLNGDPRDVLLVDDAREPIDRRTFRDVACGFYWTEGLRGLGWAVDSIPTLKGGSTIGIPSQPAIIFPNGDVGKPDLRDAERLQGFFEDWTEPAEAVIKRSGRWKLLGNAVTVPTAHWLGSRLRRPGKYDSRDDEPLPRGASWPSAAWNVGAGRRRAAVSTWPVKVTAAPLADFLRYPTEPLSIRATEGFLSRARVAKLNFPEGFISALEDHLARMRQPIGALPAFAIA